MAQTKVFVNPNDFPVQFFDTDGKEHVLYPAKTPDIARKSNPQRRFELELDPDKVVDARRFGQIVEKSPNSRPVNKSGDGKSGDSKSTSTKESKETERGGMEGGSVAVSTVVMNPVPESSNPSPDNAVELTAVAAESSADAHPILDDDDELDDLERVDDDADDAEEDETVEHSLTETADASSDKPSVRDKLARKRRNKRH